MTRLTWSDTSDRMYETGLDRGVLYPKNSPAVPWSGLSSVEEAGGEEATAYYIDGRPYLFLPKPKEFVASLKAYTYPDALSEIMGLNEITDGMYLDSQMGDSFDLSYRTLIGNMESGTEAGYKIHLVYNATVVYPEHSYMTLSSDVNPVEFVWEINAVPVPITGHRPTAHIVIDTRHLDSERLAKVEALIYGDSTTDAAMPLPEALFDALSFDDTITITDNGDGTWTAEGAYSNLKMLEDGVFQIDNVDGTNNADGTFTMNSTVLPPEESEPTLDGNTSGSVVDGGTP